jgi:microcystin-dependent protein
MARPYVGEIRLFACVTPPAGWLPCDGTVLPIGIYQLLYAQIGNEFGGVVGSTFALPDLRGRVPLHYDDKSYLFAGKGGEAQHRLTPPELGTHQHLLMASISTGSQVIPNGNLLAQSPAATPFYQPSDANRSAMDANQIGNTGGGGAHENMAPFVTLQFCIANDNVT